MSRSLHSTWAYPLADTWPEDTICLQLEIPDSAYWREVAITHLALLSYWFVYDRDAARTGAKVANRWKQALRTLEVGKCNTAPLVRTEYVYPPWLSGGNGCFTVDMADLDATLNIIQRVDVCRYGQKEFCPPDEWKVSAQSGGNEGVNAVDINNLQQQIDALQSEVDNLQQQASQQGETINLLSSDINQLQSDLNTVDQRSINNFGDIQSLAQTVDDERQKQIASLRWYPNILETPPGWIAIDGQRIPKLPTVSGDSLILYDRVPDSWRDGDDVLLPLYVDLLPIGPSRDNENAGFGMNYGANRTLWTQDTKPSSGDRSLNAVKGRWLIYIGDSAIS